ncbi:MAG: hypothetical protein V4812_21295 [Pseudomonadota bacterium]
MTRSLAFMAVGIALLLGLLGLVFWSWQYGGLALLQLGLGIC